jgi:ATP-dependent DNA ligase
VWQPATYFLMTCRYPHFAASLCSRCSSQALVCFMVFDLLELDGADLRRHPQDCRSDMLITLFNETH